jgi:pimeloyl-ACP methyl ester carboxylesterase
VTAENSPTPAAPDTIVLIHGLWVTPRSWEKWVEHYEGRGYRVLPPPTQALKWRSKRSTRIPPRLRP